jgi:hypothetical protein
MVGRSRAPLMGRQYQVPGRTVEAAVNAPNGNDMRL